MFKKGYTNNNFLYLSAVALIEMNIKFIFFHPWWSHSFLYNYNKTYFDGSTLQILANP